MRPIALAALIAILCTPVYSQTIVSPSATTINDATNVANRATVTGGNLFVQPNPAVLTPFDRGTSVVTGGTPVRVMQANQLRKDGWIQNPSSASTRVLCSSTTSSFTATAAAGIDVDLSPGQSYALGGPFGVIRSDIYCTAPDSGHVILAKELQ